MSARFAGTMRISGIRWPLPPGVPPVISGRDAAARAFRDAEYYP